MVAAVGPPVVCAALPRLPFGAAVFDAVVGAFVLNHVGDPTVALAELARVLRPGGRLVLAVWDADVRNRALGVINEALAEVDLDRSTIPAGPSASGYATLRPFAALLSGAGLVDVRVDQVTWTHRVAPDRWWEDVVSGTVRTAAVVLAQDAAIRMRIRAAFDRIVTPCVGPDEIATLRASALLAVGVAPSATTVPGSARDSAPA